MSRLVLLLDPRLLFEFANSASSLLISAFIFHPLVPTAALSVYSSAPPAPARFLLREEEAGNRQRYRADRGIGTTSARTCTKPRLPAPDGAPTGMGALHPGGAVGTCAALPETLRGCVAGLTSLHPVENSVGGEDRQRHGDRTADPAPSWTLYDRASDAPEQQGRSRNDP